MAYQALYRKWRPSNFDEVRGQDHIVTTLKNQIEMNRIGHAYLFCGTRGTGKTSIAKIFAKAVNCEHPVNGSPCNECAMCRAVNEQRSMNVIEIDAASNNGVDNIREIREEVAYSPSEGKYKVYIIDEVHMLSIGAFNALLKTLEEPPSYVIFILATTEAHKIPITILSRFIGSAASEGYIIRDIILNEEQPQHAAQRAIDMVMKKIKGEPFESELLPPKFDIVEPAPPVADITKAKLALVSDGGLIPESNPDKLKPNGSTTWGHYDWDKLIAEPHFVIHSGYDGTWVMENPYRLFPVDVLREAVAEGRLGELEPEVYVVTGNCASVAASKEKGRQIAQALLAKGVNAVILTST